MNEPLASFNPVAIERQRYGIIEMREGHLRAIRFRRWPRWVTLLDVQWLGPRFHDRTSGDRCLLYYNQPLGHRNFLALAYVLSTRQCTLATFHGGLTVLDEIARIKRSDALLCDAWNSRISDRLLARWGWEPHAPSRWHRNYIKRFYGSYPTQSLQSVLGLLAPSVQGVLAKASREATSRESIAGVF